mmetsp:Transcript_19766/g.32708  ORF Transcript_19766/g.32708 Transcript_19766/m.32708 type:complete len:168 (-) Transcript_19766:63-566(-)
MKPDVAAVLTSKRLKRPSTGMPDAFYVDGKAPSPNKNPLKQILKSKIIQRIVLPAVGIGLSAFLTTNAIQHSGRSIGSAATSSPVAPAPEGQTAEPMNDESPRGRKKRKTTSQSPPPSPVATKIVVDEELNEAAALKTGTHDIPKDLNDSWVDRATSRLLEAFRFQR